MEIHITPESVIQSVIGFGLIFGTCYFCAWLLLRKNWFIKIIGIYMTLNVFILVSDNGSATFWLASCSAYVIAFREVILALLRSFFEWFLIIKDYLEAFIRIIIYPFTYAIRYIYAYRLATKESANYYEEDYKKAEENINKAKAKARQSQKNSEKARKRAEAEREWYKEEVKRAREEARRQQEQEENNTTSAKNNSSTVDNRSPEQILGLQSGFNKAELKKAYRRASSQYHPDKHTHMPQEFQDQASEEFKKVQGAYKKLLNRF